jgi:hypothetical protein
VWLGGKAVVLAESEEQAIELVRSHRSTLEFEKVEVAACVPVTEPVVIFNDNGDY